MDNSRKKKKREGDETHGKLDRGVDFVYFWNDLRPASQPLSKLQASCRWLMFSQPEQQTDHSL